MRLSECELAVSSIIEDLEVDPWPVEDGNRAHRCTGAAMSIALDLLQVIYSLSPPLLLVPFFRFLVVINSLSL